MALNSTSSSSSTLKLIIEKGPRCGETLEFNPRSKIRLGRLVRGNNVTVKDAGISSKHLSIDFDSGLGKWVITDLDSSNGTILNSSQLKPLIPFVIDHDDVIKVGELTLIRVSIDGIGEIGEEIRVRVGDVGIGGKESVMVEDGVDLEGNGEGKKGRGRGRPKAKKVVDVVAEVKAVNTRKTRSSRKEAEELLSLDVVGPVRRTRRAKKVEEVAVCEVGEGSKVDDVGGGEAGNDVGVVESVKPWGGRGRRKKVVEEESNDVKGVVLGDDGVCGDVSKKVDVEDVTMKEVEEGSKLDVGGDGKAQNVGAVKNKRTRGGRSRKKKAADVKEVDEVTGFVADDETRKDLSGRFSEGEKNDASQRDVVEEKATSDLSGDAERIGGSWCDGEQQGEEPVCVLSQQNEVEHEMNERLLGENVGASSQQNEREDEMAEVILGENVCEPVEGALDAREQSRAEPTCDTVQRDSPGDATNEETLVAKEAEAGGSLSRNQQPSSEPLDETDREIELNNEEDLNVLEAKVPESVDDSSCAREEPTAQPIDDTTAQDETVLGASDAGKEIIDKHESSLASEDQLMEESASGEIPEATSSGYHGGTTDRREPVPAPDLEKMTLGEWFDYLEVYLPQQIYDATDEIINEMRQRAKQFNDFMLKQQQQM